jgi:RNA polymerase sigma-70 factor (ECF subfamily)
MPASDAEDIVEEAFLRVVNTKAREKNRFDPCINPSASAFKTWLYAIALNLRGNWRRKMNRREIQSLDEPTSEDEGASMLIELQADATPTGAELLAARELSEPVYACLQALAPLHREILALADMEDFDLADAARLLDIPYATAGTRLFNARRKMRECLAAKGYRMIAHGESFTTGARIILRSARSLLICEHCADGG